MYRPGRRHKEYSREHPGRTFVDPGRNILKSSANYPAKEEEAAVYGNPANIGIRYSKEAERVKYSDFRKRKQDDVDDDADEEAVLSFLKHNGGGGRRSGLQLDIDPVQTFPIIRHNRYKERERDRYPRAEIKKLPGKQFLMLCIKINFMDRK
ncbi:uncharacterized protein LOC126382166 [Pectinophora gossypiella]|uniref:uncharacterized protein LOC126382166 n=1 Tax=Pectinophora gossypiella TaxID=13191 RepID=UPI00214F2EA6|nr:uncharacterized protein LOC126382166 [Pectinophora gossypiella]